MKVRSNPFLFRAFCYAVAALLLGCATNAELIEGQNKILGELAEIKTLLKESPARAVQKPFEPTDVSIAESPVRGDRNAPVTLVEFTDYQCPYCKRHALVTVPQIIKDFVDSGKLKYVIREFPLTAIHPKAQKLSEAALCAGNQGKYWEMHDRFFSETGKPDPANLSADLGALGLNAEQFKECLDSGRYAKQVETDLADGVKLGVRGTPSFFIGKTNPASNRTVRATRMLSGAQGYPTFQAEIEKVLNEEGRKK